MSNQVRVEKIYDLSPMQEGMFYHSLLQEKTEMYFEQISFSILGDLDVQVFERSVQWLTQRHDILRTNFIYQNMKKPQQVVLNGRDIKVFIEDLTHLSHKESRNVIESYQWKDKQQGFDLSRDLLMRFALFQINESEWKVIWSFHHILLDGWSTGIVMKELFEIYYSIKDNKPVRLENTKPYVEFIEWIQEDDHIKSLDYWKQYLMGYEERGLLPTCSYLNGEGGNSEFSFRLSEEMTSALNEFSKQNHVTLNTTFQSIWSILLQRYTNQTDVAFGTVLSGRTAPIRGIEKMVGLFINTVPVRMKKKNGSFIDLVKDLQRQAFVSEEHCYCPLYEIQKQSVHKQDLLDHIIVFENYPLDQEVQSMLYDQRQDLQIREVKSFSQTNYPITILVLPGKSMEIKIIFNHSLYDTTFISRIEHHFKQVAQSIIENPTMEMDQIQILTESEKQQLLTDWNNTDVPFPSNQTIHQLFEEQALKTPDRVAVVYQNEKLTYQELNQQANTIAHMLREKGVRFEDRVGLLMGRSLDMVVSILAILKSGAAYVPIDPLYPAERVQYMLQDSGAKVVLSQSAWIEMKNEETSLIEWIDVQQIQNKGFDSSNLSLSYPSSCLAYVIYTSGTTGQPKGVMMEHRQVVNLLYDQIIKKQVPFHQKVLQFSSIGFDVSFQEIFSTLLSGGSLYVIHEQMRKDVNRLLTYLEEHAISVVYWPVSYLKAVFQWKDQLPSTIKHIITAGEQLIVSPSLKQYIFENSVQVHNHYGPAETHVVTTYTLPSQKESDTYPPIGKPIANTKIYLLNENRQLQPLGVTGEIYIAGDCVSRGYLKKWELTAERFIKNPFVPGERMYRTGDLGRYLPDGNIEFLGRVDHQVKVRGYRIELGEIESTLLEHPDVKDVTVRDWQDENDNVYLCAYVITDRLGFHSEWRSYLGQRLPDYMIPAFIMELEEIPLTPNRKVDRNRLPKPNRSSLQEQYVAPTTNLQKQLADIWQKVLGIKQVGVTDHFFEIGGHSIKAIQLVSLIHQHLQFEISISIIFEYPTILKLATFMEGKEQSTFESILPAPVQPFYPASSAQKRVYVLQQLDSDAIHYNMPGAIMLEGRLDFDRLELAFQQLIHRHEALRTSFKVIDGNLVQQIHASVNWQCNRRKGRQEEAKIWINQFTKPFVLDQAPLFRSELIELEEEKHLLMIDLHHIIADGVSIDVMLKDLSLLYEGRALSDLSIQYKDFAVWQLEWVKSSEFQRQEKYWLDHFEGEIPVLRLPTDHFYPQVQSFEGDQITFALDEKLTTSLKELASKTETTLYMLLLAAYNVLLQKYTGQSDILVGSPVLGRNHAEIQSIMGMFVNTIVMRNRPEPHKQLIDFVKEVKEGALAAYEHADYPFERLVEKLPLVLDTSRNPLFQTMFSMQDFGRNILSFDGIETKPFELKFAISKVDLSLFVREDQNQITCEMRYATVLFEQETIRRMTQHFVQIVREIINNPAKCIAEVDMLTESEKYQLLGEWNDTASDFPKEKTIQELFEKQVVKNPDKLAVVYQKEKLTYQQLNEQANGLANVLRQRGVKPDDRVGLLMERSLDMIVGILAILKSGGAYVPIDPEYPVKRVQYMLEDSGAKIVLSQGSIMTRFQDKDKLVVDWIDKDTMDTDQDSVNLPLVNQSNDLAYVIYTSGTTGKPKGVMIEHHSVVNFVDSLRSEVHVQKRDRVGSFVSISFDASVGELGMSILSGATLYIVPKEMIQDHFRFENYVNSNKLTLLSLPPSYLTQLNRNHFPSLRQVLAIGSATPSDLVRQWKDIYINAYGPTEATVYVSLWKDTKQNYNTAYAPLGKLIANTKAYIVNENMQQQPVGVSGELCVGGAGLARGYLGKTDLTAEKFVQNPFVSGEKMYRTGDLTRYLPDGNIEFLGRLDHQVKVRGYRIELGEIESILLEHEKVKDVVVKDWTDEQKEIYLCAYVVLDDLMSSAELKDYLNQKLPSYMIPSFVIMVDEIPLTPNRKIDYKALPKPDGSQRSRKYVAPTTEREEQLVLIWKEVLGMDQVSVTDHFFELGGHSIKAISLISHIEAKLNHKVSLSHVFQYPTIREFARSAFPSKDTQVMTLLNQKTGTNIFCFPPLSGFGSIFSEMAQLMDMFTFYSFDFISSDDRIQQYIGHIVSVQKEGPYLFLGYSAGCSLMYEVAKEMEKQGYEVADLIMLDKAPEQEIMCLLEEEVQIQVEELVEVYLQHQLRTYVSSITKQMFVQIVKNYTMYLNQLVNEGKINASIHLIKADDTVSSVNDWQKKTTQFYTYVGAGNHLDMLVYPFLEKNVEVIRCIISNKVDKVRDKQTVI